MLKTGDISGYIRGYNYESKTKVLIMKEEFDYFSINNRIMLIMRENNFNKNSLSKELNISQPALSKIEKNENLPSFKLLFEILKKFPNISPEWLMTGKGKMLKEKGSLMPEDQQHLFDICDELKKKCEKLSKEIEEKDAVIKNLVKTNLLLVESKNGGVAHRGNDAECADVG